MARNLPDFLTHSIMYRNCCIVFVHTHTHIQINQHIPGQQLVGPNGRNVLIDNAVVTTSHCLIISCRWCRHRRRRRCRTGGRLSGCVVTDCAAGGRLMHGHVLGNVCDQIVEQHVVLVLVLALTLTVMLVIRVCWHRHRRRFRHRCVEDGRALGRRRRQRQPAGVRCRCDAACGSRGLWRRLRRRFMSLLLLHEVLELFRHFPDAGVRCESLSSEWRPVS